MKVESGKVFNTPKCILKCIGWFCFFVLAGGMKDEPKT